MLLAGFSFLGLKFFFIPFSIKWKIVQKFDLTIFNLETIMAHAICDCQICWLQSEIIAADLGKSDVIYRNKWRFAFNQKKRQTVFREYHYIRPFGQRMIFHTRFNGKKRLGISVVIY